MARQMQVDSYPVKTQEITAVIDMLTQADGASNGPDRIEYLVDASKLLARAIASISEEYYRDLLG